MRTVFANLVFSAVLPLAMAASTVGGADKYPYVEGQEVIADIGGPVAVAKPWKTLEEVDDPLRHLVANASGVRFQPPTEVVDDILAQEKKNADTESLVDYECVLDILHMEHSLRFEGTLKCGEGGGGKPPRWALVGIDLMDLAIDSDNNNKYADPDMGKEERDMEEDEPGKIFLVDDDDLDYDGVPDFADGFSAWKETDYASVSSADPEEELPLVPVILEIRVSEKNAVILGSVGITFEYTMSDPDPAKGDLKRKKVGETEDGKPIYEHSATPGFRLWLSNAASRDKRSLKNGGSFVPASSGSQAGAAMFTLSDFGVPLDPEGKKPKYQTIRIKLYLEATPGAEDLRDQFITAKVTARIHTKAGDTKEVSQTDKVRINPIRMQFVTRGETDDDIVPTKFVGVCTPRPEVKLVDARKYDIKINKAGGYAALTLKCDEILDPVADNLPEGVGEIKNVEIIVDGGDSQSASGAPVPVKAVDAGPPSFWKQHPYKGKFADTTVRIPLEEGTHTVEVRSGENAAGLTGFDEVSVTLTKEVTYIPGNPGTTVVANIYLPEEPADGKKDKLRYYFGRRKPREDDPVFAERRRKSLKFHGELEGLAAKVAISDFKGLTDKKDSFTAKVPVVVATANKKKILYLTAVFKETKKKSNLFRATITYGATAGRTKTKWKVAKVENSIGSGKGSYMPFTMRIKGLPEGYEKNALLTWDTKGSKLTENHFAPNDGWLYPLSASILMGYAIDTEKKTVLVVRLETDENGDLVMENGQLKFIVEESDEKGKITGKLEFDLKGFLKRLWMKKLYFPYIKITHPRVVSDLKPNETLAAIFNTDIGKRPYCFENQGVALSSEGKDERKHIPIEAEVNILDDWRKLLGELEWVLEDKNGKALPNGGPLGTIVTGKNAGEKSPLKGYVAPPKNIPLQDVKTKDGKTKKDPDAPAAGFIALRFKKHPEIRIANPIEIFRDHLARDAANFLDGKQCTPRIELKDGSRADASLVCSTAFVHAHKGEIGNAHKLWKNLREKQKWIENIGQRYKWGPNANHRTQGYKWGAFITKSSRIKLKWNDKVWLGMKSKSGKLVMLHPSTVITKGSGATAKTYSADAVSKKFIHQTVGWYYKHVNWVKREDRRIWILQPPRKNKEDTENE